jgi:hypothetical protein
MLLLEPFHAESPTINRERRPGRSEFSGRRATVSPSRGPPSQTDMRGPDERWLRVKSFTKGGLDQRIIVFDAILPRIFRDRE